MTYLQTEKDESKYKSRESLMEKREVEKATQTGRYKLDNRLIDDSYVADSSQYTFVSSMGSVSIFVVVCIVLVSSSVIADEFNKGTIKQLLVRPFSRSKIIIAKLLAILTTILLFVVLVSIGQSLVSGIINHDLKTLIDPYVMYSFDSHSVITSNTLFSGLLEYACILPEIIILTLLTVLVSVLFTNNGVSTAIGIVTYAAAGILEIYVDAKPIISYIPLVNWDFSMYLFGAMPQSKYLVLSKSLYICISTAILLFIGILLFFKHKDIKNQ
jgi:ABC-2 type transport system permease protein